MSASMRWIAAGAVLLGGAGLMWQGRGLWDWATGEPRGDELLIVATAIGDMPRAKRAIAQGASVDAQSATGCTPLALAAGIGHEDLVSLLLLEGADANTPLYCGRRALEFTTAQSCDPGIVCQLLRAGADPDGSAGEYVGSPLVQASAKGSVPVVEMLLDYGADPNPHLRGRGDWSPLQVALDNGSEDVAELLVRHGAVR